MIRPVTTYYLEMAERAHLIPARVPDEPCALVHAELACPELSRFFYTAVGGNWYWTMRLPWSYAEWQAFVGRPGFETWYGVHRGVPVGYFELLPHADDSVEIASFGLLPQFIGQGFGGQLLAAAIERAWVLGPARVTVHTCTLDGPHALRNYLARGFRQVDQETTERALSDLPPGPWPGAAVRSPERR